MNVNLDLYYENAVLAAYLIDNRHKPTVTPTASIDLTEAIDLLIRDGWVQRTIHRKDAITVDHHAKPTKNPPDPLHLELLDP